MMGNCHVQTDHSTIDRSCRIFRNPLACSLSPRRPCLVQKTTLILDHPPRTIAVGGNTSPKMTGARESALLVDRGFSGIFILPPIVQSVPIPFDLVMSISPFYLLDASLTPSFLSSTDANPRVRLPASRHSAFPSRLTSGCDACRARKVRCSRENPDEPKQSCNHCITLAIPCTYDYRPKKRGPPNLCAVLHPHTPLFITSIGTCVV